jgi:hypothetical protein
MDIRVNKIRDWQARCVVCGETFAFKDGFECTAQPGRHTVDPKEYYHLGAGHIQSIRERRRFTPMLNLAADKEVRDKVTGEITRLEGLVVHFREGGKYETTDPLEQYHLDMHPAVMTGLAGREAWDKMYLTQEQQLNKAQGQLADIQKQIRESNVLLDLTKGKKAGEKDGMAVR